MARKDTEKKYQMLLEREKRLKEEMKEAKKQMLKEEREERKHCYMEIGKLVESCLPRNLQSGDIESFSKFVTEKEELIASYFGEDLSEPEEEVEEEVEYEEEAVEDETPPFGGQ